MREEEIRNIKEEKGKSSENNNVFSLLSTLYILSTPIYIPKFFTLPPSLSLSYPQCTFFLQNTSNLILLLYFSTSTFYFSYFLFKLPFHSHLFLPKPYLTFLFLLPRPITAFLPPLNGFSLPLPFFRLHSPADNFDS